MHLLVVIEDKTADWINKGEIRSGYFNPSSAFQSITVLGLTEDKADEQVIKALCKPATSRFIGANLNRRTFAMTTAGLRYNRIANRLTPLMNDKITELPHVIRAYGDGLGAVVGSVIANEFRLPFAVSLHTTSDPKTQLPHLGFKDRLWRFLLANSVQYSLRKADAIMAVYTPIPEFLPPDIASKIKIIPNAVGIKKRLPPPVEKKGPLQAIWVSRQILGRDPRPVISALSHLQNVRLTLVGTGPLHQEAQRIASHPNIKGRAHFIPAVKNKDLCDMLPQYDVMLVNSEFREMPKSVMEASLSGLSIIVNQNPARETVEYSRLPVIYVSGSSESYAEALRACTENTRDVCVRGKQTAEIAWSLWDPKLTEEKAARFLTSLIKTPQQSKGQN